MITDSVHYMAASAVCITGDVGAADILFIYVLSFNDTYRTNDSKCLNRAMLT